MVTSARGVPHPDPWRCGLAEPAPPAGSRGTPRILLVEDEPAVRDSLTRFLERRGYRVDSATDIDSALARFAELSVDAAVLDVVLPHGDGPVRSGLDLLGWLRERPATARLPVVILTGYPLEDAARVLLERFDAALFYKPEDYASLVRHLEEVIRRPRPPAE